MIILFPTVLVKSVLALIALLCLVVIFGAVFFIYSGIQKRKAEKYRTETNDGRMIAYVEECEEQINQNIKEVEKISKDITELKASLNTQFEIAPERKIESEKLIRDFENEVKLREAKIEFFKTCKEKLNTLIYNQKLSKTLAAKKEALEKLKEQHFEDIAPMEALASDIEHDKMYLESIEDLKFRIESSKSADSALELRSELIQMTKELKKL